MLNIIARPRLGRSPRARRNNLNLDNIQARREPRLIDRPSSHEFLGLQRRLDHALAVEGDELDVLPRLAVVGKDRCDADVIVGVGEGDCGGLLREGGGGADGEAEVFV